MITITPEYLRSQGLSEDFPERFFEKVFVLTYDTGCHLWIGDGAKHGIAVDRYGKIHMGDRGSPVIRAHVAAYILQVGLIPDGMCVCHRCDVGLCVRPDHLWLGTHLENMADMTAKKRYAAHRGEENGCAKLTWEQASDIRSRYDPIRKNGEILAREFGVTRRVIRLIYQGHLWRPENDPRITQPTELPPWNTPTP